MHIAKDAVTARIDAPGAKARQTADFGDASAFGTLSGEYFSLEKGTDIAPLLQGLEGDLCQAPHWGYLLEGELVVTYTDEATERVEAGDLFHWPPGHSVRVDDDAEVIMFSPKDEHGAVIAHMLRRMGG